MNRMLAFGVQQLFRGARQGQPLVAGLGAALSLISFVRQRSGPKKSLIYARNLREGETIKIRLVRDTVVVDEMDVEG